MTDRQALLAVFALIYLTECLFWVRRGAVAFRTWLGRRWQYVPDGELARNDHGGLHWAWPLPPFGDLLVARGLPVSIGPNGVLSFTAECPHPSGRALHLGRFVPWESVQSTAAEGSRLLVNREAFWVGDTVHTPAQLASLIIECARLPGTERVEKIRQAIASQFDTFAFEARLKAFRAETRWLDSLCLGYFAFVFALVPALINRFGWFPALWFLIPAMFLQSGLIAWTFRRLHQGRYAKAVDDRFKHTLVIAMAPASTIRARDTLMRGVVEDFHPLCAAAALLEPGEFERVARVAWRDLQFPMLPESPSGAVDVVETERWYRAECRDAFRRLLKEKKMEPDTWTQAPAPSERVNTLYCPRCESQFTAVAKSCGPCGGRSLLPLAKA